MPQEKPPNKIAFIIALEDKGNEVKAITLPHREYWKIAGVMPSRKSSDLFRLAFLFAARAYRKATELEKSGGRLMPERDSDTTKIALVGKDDPDCPVWEPVVHYWIKSFLSSYGPKKLICIPQDLKDDLAALFPKRGKREKGRPFPLVTLAHAMSSKDFFFCSLQKYNISKGRTVSRQSKPSPQLRRGEQLTLKNLQDSALDEECVADLMQRILVDIYRSEIGDKWWVRYTDGLSALKPDHFYSLQTRPVKRRDRDLQLPHEQLERSASDEPILEVPRRYDGLLREHHKAVLIGPSGAGKTTIMSAMARAWIKEHGGVATPTTMPILVRLGDYESGKKLSDLIVESLSDIVPRSWQKGYAKDIERWLRSENSRSKHVAFLFDGYNDLIEGRRAFQRQFMKFLRSHADNRIVVSAQTYGAEDLEPSWPRVTLEKPTIEQIEEYLERSIPEVGSAVFNNQVKRDPKLYSLAETPFNLKLIAEYIKENRFAKLPPNQGKLIESMVLRSIERKKKEGVILPDNVYDSEVQDFLQSVAHSLIKRRTLDGSEEDAQDTAVRHPDDTLPLWRRKDDIASLQEVLKYAKAVGFLERSGLERHNNRVIFHHDLYRDYFAARYLLDHKDELFQDLESEYLEYVKWDEPLLMMGDLSDDEDLCSGLMLRTSKVDMRLAAEFALRACSVRAETCLELLPDLLSYGDSVPGRHRERDLDVGRAAFQLLSRFDPRKLTEVYERFSDEPLVLQVIYPILLQDGPSSQRPTHPDIEALDEPRTIALLKGLSYLGTRDALNRAIDIITRAVPRLRRSGDSPRRNYDIFSILGTWRAFLSVGEILELLKSQEDPGVRSPLSMLLYLGRLKLGEIDLSALAQLLDDPDEVIAHSAMFAAGRIGGERAVRMLTGLLEKHLEILAAKHPCACEDSDLQAVLASFAMIHSERAAQVLRESVMNKIQSLSESNIKDIIWMISLHGGEAQAELLVELLPHTERPGALCSALQRFRRSERIVKRLNHLRESASLRHVHDKAALALGLMGHQLATSDVLEILNRPLPPLIEIRNVQPEGLTTNGDAKRKRREGILNRWCLLDLAVRAAGALMRQEAAPRVLELGQSDDVPFFVKATCVNVLADLKYVASLQFLLSVFHEGRGVEGWHAAAALAEIAPCLFDEQCYSIVSALRESYDEAVKKHHEAIIRCNRLTTERILIQRKRRFTEHLAGWPLGLKCVPTLDQPEWLRELRKHIVSPSGVIPLADKQCFSSQVSPEKRAP